MGPNASSSKGSSSGAAGEPELEQLIVGVLLLTPLLLLLPTTSVFAAAAAALHGAATAVRVHDSPPSPALHTARHYVKFAHAAVVKWWPTLRWICGNDPVGGKVDADGKSS